MDPAERKFSQSETKATVRKKEKRAHRKTHSPFVSGICLQDALRVELVFRRRRFGHCCSMSHCPTVVYRLFVPIGVFVPLSVSALACFKAGEEQREEGKKAHRTKDRLLQVALIFFGRSLTERFRMSAQVSHSVFACPSLSASMRVQPSTDS